LEEEPLRQLKGLPLPFRGKEEDLIAGSIFFFTTLRILGSIFPPSLSYGNVNELGNVSRCPGKSSLFFLTCSNDPGIMLYGDRVR
jgi:hypothetical protein